MRDLTATLEARLGRAVTEPTGLAELALPGGLVVRASTRGAVTWGGHTWDHSLDLAGLREIAGGGVQGTLRLDNRDHALTPALTGADDPRGGPVRVWLGDGDEMVLMVAGELDAVGAVWPVAEIAITSQGVRRMLAPRVRLLPPLVRHLTPPGTIIDWGGERIVLEAER